ncbi:bile acid:sodium symporter family protein [Corynebacterium sputi]|uniref:bile acid:sodium symporter family protein n=1 Tax=Corynebacterium sputi TaxID=489915 RepID=UPI00040636EA|nr:bile acid:sodium symporter family protein [Corynebacterium sputi]
MWQRLRKWRPDPLIVLIIVALILGLVLPARGEFAEGFDVATKIAIAFLFFLYGVRLSPREAIDGVRHWKLHLTIMLITFVMFPIIGLLMKPTEWFLGTGLYMGILFMCLVPSTVQSSVNFTSIAKGNVAGAVVAASASNLMGIFLTPLLVMALMTRDGELHVDGSVFFSISLQLLLPFLIGQFTRRWTYKFAASPITKNVDRISIAMVVYAAFSQGMVDGIWAAVPASSIIFLCVFSVVLVWLLLKITGVIGKTLHFNRADRITIMFAGSKKSLATGLPMAAVIFAGNAGEIILPLMIFHQIQLMMCAWYAAKWGKEYEEGEKSSV